VAWRFAFETRRSVSRSKIDNVVDEIVKLLEYAKGFPQEHLMSAAPLLVNRHCAQSPSINSIKNELYKKGCVSPNCWAVWKKLDFFNTHAGFRRRLGTTGDAGWPGKPTGHPDFHSDSVE
jgi:hypothetical protein